MGDNAFQYCGQLKDVTISESMTGIGYQAFMGCGNLASIIIPNRVTGIGGAAFQGCTSLTSVMIGDSVTSIGPYAFERCTSLTEITIPDSVTSIQIKVFQNCPNLTSVYYLGDSPSITAGYGSIYEGAGPVISYYRPGTVGWSETFSDRPTAPWFLPNPTILDFGPSFGVISNNKFGFIISWATNADIVVDATSSLFSPGWVPVSTNTLVDGVSTFTDPNWTNYPARFYRLREY